MTAGPEEALAYVALRVGGRKLRGAWAAGPSDTAAIAAASDAALLSLPKARRRNVDAAEVCVAGEFRPIELERLRTWNGNSVRGILGLELSYRGQVTRYPPTEMIALNLSFKDALTDFKQRHQLADQDAAEQVTVRLFDARQMLIILGPKQQEISMYRGAELVHPEEVTENRLATLVEGLTGWLMQNMTPGGRMTYKYLPSSEAESVKANNAIRQWMATVALGRAARASGDRRVLDAARRNLLYNLKTTYRDEGALGIIEDSGGVKLGALALAALAVTEIGSPMRYPDAEQKLCATIDELWNADGSFETFLRPAGRSGDNANFYPGEALLYWATRCEKGDEERLEAFMKSFRFYRRWHQQNRNPAFVPWHTQAYCKIWKITGDEQLLDTVFWMNDWLLDLQQWEDAPFADMRGRFYNPERRRQYGPPHASSTGVYLEGLIDAFRMATEVGDVGRAENYRRAIVRGLRSVCQLQFNTEAEMYYVVKKDRVRGGVRTTEYDNTIRVDNVQHNLMAALKVLESFQTDSYACS